MTEASTERQAAPAQVPLAVIGVVALVIGLRLVHLSSAALSPLTYQLGPDEDYYFRFARAVASGSGANSPEFTFMDPAYGYLVGGLFKLFGPSVFLIFGLQCLVDTATAVAILLIGRELGRPRAGQIGALLYGLTSLAIMYSCSLLKEVWVAACFTWWVLIALRASKPWIWLLLGVFCGVGVAFRSTLLLLALASLLLALRHGTATESTSRRLRAGLVAIGLAVALLPWSLRNFAADGSLSPLPHNGGIVLHQIYNSDNPDSSIWIPPFVSYLQPSDIWRGYESEAERRAHQALTPAQVDSYWKSQALDYMKSNPGAVSRAVLGKGLQFLASKDVPVNRSLQEEAMFSTVLKVLPAAAPWLLALGLVGLVWFALNDHRWPLLALPIVIAWLTFAFFWAEDRFRYHAMAILALCAGLGIDLALSALQSRQRKAMASFGVAVGALCAASFALGGTVKVPPRHWDQIVWGYIKMGRPQEALALAQRVAIEQPQNAPIEEALGYLAVLRHDYPAAVDAYRKAVTIRPRSDQAHFNLARALLETGQRAEALEQARIALTLRPDPDYESLVRKLEGSP